MIPVQSTTVSWLALLSLVVAGCSSSSGTLGGREKCWPDTYRRSASRWRTLAIDAFGATYRAQMRSGGDGGESNSPSKAFSRRPATSVSDDLSSTQAAGIGTVDPSPSTFPCGLCDQIRSLTDRASPLNDASTTGGETAASTLTLPRYAARARDDWRLPVTSFAA
jgi:hypothetical protein